MSVFVTDNKNFGLTKMSVIFSKYSSMGYFSIKHKSGKCKLNTI